MPLNLAALPNPPADTTADQLQQRYRSQPSTPDETARVYNAAAGTGWPAETVRNNLPTAQRVAQEPDWNILRQRAPSVTSFFANNPDFFDVAHDDIEQYAQLEAEMRDHPGERAKALLKGGYDSFTGMPWAISNAFSHGLDQLSMAQQLFWAAASSKFGVEKDQADVMLPMGTSTQILNRTSSAINQDQEAQFQKSMAGMGTGGQMAMMVAQNVLTNLPYQIAAVATGQPNMALIPMSLSSAGQAYQRATDKGLSHTEATQYAFEQGFTEYFTEGMPLSRLIERIGAGNSLWKTVVMNILEENYGEQAATFLQDLSDWAHLNPDKTLVDFFNLKERGNAALQTAVVTTFSTLLMGGASYGVGRMAQAHVDRQNQIAITENTKRILGVITDVAARSQALKRGEVGTQAFEEAVKAAAKDSPVQEVLLDAKALGELYQDELPKVLESLGVTQQQYNEAAAMDDFITVAVEKFAARLATRPEAKGMLQHVKFSAEDLTDAQKETQLKQAEEELKSQAETILTESADRVAQQTQFDEIHKLVTDALVQTAAFPENVAKDYATWATRFWTVAAHRHNQEHPDAPITAMDLYTQSRFNLASQRLPGIVLEQAVTPIAEPGSYTIKPHEPGQATFVMGEAGNQATVRQVEMHDGRVGFEAIMPDSTALGVFDGPHTAAKAVQREMVNRGMLDQSQAPLVDQNGAVLAQGPIETPEDASEETTPLVETTAPPVPESVDAKANLKYADQVARSKVWDRGRDLKVAIQQAVLNAAEKAGVRLSTPSDSLTEYLVRVGMDDALAALKRNSNAIGWYDLKTRQALALIALIHPEIKTDENAKFAFIWALAVTSNGQKVAKNFELAEAAYAQYKDTGQMPSNLTAGQAQKAINDSLELFNTLKSAWSIEDLHQFMVTRFTVGEISAIDKELKPGGEHVDTEVRGSAILGPKIGNGFFSNLYGMFDALTMDRWLVRTWGRWTGTLIQTDPTKVAQARGRLLAALTHASHLPKADLDALEAAVGISLTATTDEVRDNVAHAIQKASMDPKAREAMNATPIGEEVRKAGNGLAKYLDGQKEAPAGPHERTYIRKVFGHILAQLRAMPEYADLTMADLQAVLWYAEKRLYERAKEDLYIDENDEVEGYSDEEAPDYANAAADLARKAGVAEDKIQATLKQEESSGRAAAARPSDGAEKAGKQGQSRSAQGFTEREKRFFIGARAIQRGRSNRAVGGGSAWAYSGEGAENGRGYRVLKKLGIKWSALWKAGRSLGTVLRHNGFNVQPFYELAQGYPENALKFSELITAAKIAQKENGAAVYVYPAKEYAKIRLFLSEDGHSGFALKPDGDIVSVFASNGAGRAVLELAVAAGGRKLDCFETILPKFYAAHGFRAVARIPWNESEAPPDWNKEHFIEFNGGEPDVVFMVYDPDFTGRHVQYLDGKMFRGKNNYGRAVGEQGRAIQKLISDRSAKKLLYQGEWRSALVDAVTSIKQEKAGGQQWLATLRNAAGVKAEELEFYDLEGWLSGQKSVTKQELLDYLAANALQVKEVLKSGDQEVMQDEAGTEYPGTADGTKFTNWQLPGGENYRELLLTLPAGIRAANASDIQHLNAELRANGFDPISKDQESILRAGGSEAVGMLEDWEARLGIDIGRLREAMQIERSFYGGHFDEPNIVAHVRFNERTDADGKRVLFIEEIQSDWHQKGRKHGYREEVTPLDSTGWTAIEQSAIGNGRSNWRITTPEGRSWTHVGDTNATAEQIIVEAAQRVPENQQRDKVPDAPFKTTWPMLGMRRMVRWAAENGFDRVAWTPGEVQADRYSIGNVVKSVEWEPRPETGWTKVLMETISGEPKYIKLNVDPDGIVRGGDNIGGAKDKALDEVVGKDVAEAISRMGRGRMAGDGLRIGGEGMRAFYDEILVKETNKFLKKFGAKVGAAEIKTRTTTVGRGSRRGSSTTYETVHAFDITPQLREAALAGLPLFQQNRGSFNPDTRTHTLLKDADLSTFIHEFGHFQLEVMFDLAGQATAPQSIKDDVAVLLKWFGVKDLATWNAMSLEEKRPFHEQFARGGEAYLMEGKAPIPELQPIFARFRAWLVAIYKDLKNLNVQLTDEVRGVFDRMVATDEEIRNAEATQGYRDIWGSEEAALKAGVSAEAWQRIQALGAAATGQATEELQAKTLKDLQWLANAKSRELKKLQAQHDKLRKQIEAAVRDEVSQRPIYRAIRFLKDGTFPEELTGKREDAAQQAGMVGNKLSLPALKEMYGEGGAARWRYLPTGPNGYTATEGLHPDLVADITGFPSGDALVEALLAAEPIDQVVARETDQRMLQEHGELTDFKAVERAAMEAIHNQARARFVQTQYDAIRKAVSEREATKPNKRGIMQTGSVVAKAVAQYAKSAIGGQKIKDVRSPYKYSAAEAKAARAAQEAARKGDLPAAAQALRSQMLAAAMFKEATKAKAEVEKILKFFKTVTNDSNKKTVAKGRDPDVVNAIREILAAYGVTGRGSKSAAEYLEIVKARDPEMFQVLEGAINRAQANSKPIGELTIDELRALQDEVDSLWHLGQRSRMMEVAGDLIDIEEAAKGLTERMDQIGVPGQMPGEVQALTDADLRISRIQYAGAFLRRMEQWCEKMDGKWGGPFLSFVFKPVKAAADAYRTDKVAYRKKFDVLLEQVKPYMTKTVIEAPEIGYTFGKGHNGTGMSELLHAILHTGNQSNMEKLLVGRKWGTVDDEGKVNTGHWDALIARLVREGVLKKEHYDFAQGVWDLLEETKPLAQKTHRDVFGFYFSEVAAEPFLDPFGNIRRGGYVPAQADPRLVKDATLKRALEQENENMSFAFPTAPKGFTQKRVKYNRPLILDLRTIPQHMDKVLLFSHMEAPVRDVQRLLKRSDVMDRLTRIQPAAYDGMILPWLNRSARQVVETPIVGDGGWARVLTAARARAGFALMLGNVTNTLQQFSGFVSAIAKFHQDGMKSHLMAATAQWISNPREFCASVSSLSPFMENRIANEISAMNSYMDEILLNASLYKRAQQWTAQHSYFLQSALDASMAPIIWTSAFNAATEKGMAQVDAIAYADGVIRQTQGSTLPEDISRVETGNAFARLFTQFAGYFNMMANTNVTAFKQTVEEMGLRKGAGKALYLFGMGALMPLWIAQLVTVAMRGGPEPDDDDWWIDDWLWAVVGMGTIQGMLAWVPGVGQVANSAINRFNHNPNDDKLSISPAVGLVETMAGAPSSVYKAIAEDGNKRKAVRDTATAISVLTGLPVTPLARPAGYWADVASGRVEPTGFMDAVRGTITGTPSPESRTH